MTVDIAELRIRIDSIEAREAARDLDRLDGSARRAEAGAGALTGVMGKLAGAFATMKVVDAANALIETQRAYDKMNASLVTATGSAAHASQAFGALQNFAASTPYGLAEVTKAFIQLRNLGLMPSERALNSYGNTASAMGKNLNQMVEAVADAATGEFERLKEFGIKAKQNGDQVGLTFQGVTTNIANNAAAIEKYLIGLGETKFAGGMELQAKTLDGAISNLGDTWEATKLKFSQSGFGDVAHASTLALTASLADLGAILDVVSGAATKEGEAVKEASGLHAALTTVFETVAVVGTNVAYVFTQVGNELGGLAAQAAAVATGEFALAKQIGVQMRADAAAARAEVDAKTEAILGASAKARKAVEDEAAAKKAVGRDDLAQYAIKQQAAGQSAEVIKKEADAYTGLITSIRSAIAENRVELAVGQDATESQRIRIKLDQDLISGKLKLSAGHIAVARAALDELAATEKLLKAQEAEKDVLEWIIKSTQARLASRDALAVEYETYGKVADARDIAMVAVKSEAELEAFLLAQRRAGKPVSDEMIGQLKLEAAERVKVEQATLAQSKALGYAAQLQAENKRFAAESIINEKARATALLAIDADTWQQRIALAGAGTEAQRLLQDEYTTWYKNQVAKPQLDEQRKFWESIEQTAHQTFISLQDGTKTAAERMKDSLKNIFFDWLYQMTLKKWIVNLQGSLSGSEGIMGAIQSAFSSGGSGFSGGLLGGASNLLSIGKSIYSGFSGGLMSSLGGMVSSLGQTFGSAYMTSFGAGMTMTPAAAAAAAGTSGAAGTAAAGGLSAGASAGAYAIPIAGWIAAGMMAAKNLYAQGWDGKNGSMNNVQQGSGIMVFDSLLRGIGLSSSAANIFSGQSTLARLLGRKNPEIESQGIRGTATASGFDGEAYANILEKGGIFRSDKRYERTAMLSGEQDAGFDSTITAMITAVKGFGDALGIQTSVIDGYSKAINVALTADEEKNKVAIAGMFSGIGDELSTLLVPNLAAFSAEGETASATLQRLVSDYQAVDLVLASISRTGDQAFGAVGLASVEARERLIAAAGGLDALASGTAFFAQNFLSPAEQMAPIIADVQQQLAGLGMAGVSTNEQFKQAVLGLTLSGQLATEAVAQQYAAMLKLAPQFKQMADHTEAAAAKLVEANKPYLDQLREMDRATMSATEIRAQDIEGMDASTVALYDLVAARRAEISASEAIAAKDAALQKQMADFVAVHYAGGQAAAAAVLPIQQLTVATDSMASGATTAANEIEAAAARAKAVASERAGIERSMMQLQGDTAGLRKLELAALDPANRALQQSYFALQDKMAAEAEAARVAQMMAEAQARAAEESKRAAEALKAAWKGATDSIFDEVARIRGLIGGGGASSLAGAQSAFAIATAQARAGDQDAAKLLPGLSRSVLELAEANAVTMLDLRRIQAQTAASLMGTGAGLASQFGLQVPSYDVGTDYVPSTGLALIHEGEKITPAAYNRPFTPSSSGTDTRALEATIERLSATVARQQQTLDAIANNTRRFADTFDVVTEGGDAMRTKEEA